MSRDRSLRVKSGSLSGHRSVLSRGERLDKMKALSGFDANKKPVLGIPKTRNIKVG
jgi:small basic protein (TIGR04137 family)